MTGNRKGTGVQIGHLMGGSGEATAERSRVTDQLAAVLQPGAIVPAGSTDTYIVVPALVAASGDDAADRFLNFFGTQIPERQHARCLSPGRAGIFRLVRTSAERAADILPIMLRRGHSADPRRGLDQAS